MDAPDGINEGLPAARAGSQAALGQILQAGRRYLLWIARRELDPDLQAKAGASDLVQETLLEAQRDFGSFRGNTEAEFLAWLRRLLLNNLANFSRHYRETAKRRVSRELPLDVVAASDHPDPALASASPAPDAGMLASEEMAVVRRAIERLPPDYQRVLTLWHQEERSFEEIAKEMGRSTAAIRMLWLRAIERLQSELEGES